MTTTLIVVFTFVVVFLVCLLLVLAWTRKSAENSSNWQNPQDSFKVGSATGGILSSLPSVLTGVFGTADVRTRIIFNGQEYSSVADMPEDVRRCYEQAMGGVLADSDRNGIPDLFERGGSGVLHTELITRKADDPTEKIRQLKEMRDSGLITEQEYESKKAEILARM